MKKLILLLMVCGSLMTTNAATDTVEVDVSKLSQVELQAYQRMKAMQAEAQSHNANPEKVSEWAKTGKALGEAFKECWGTVSNDVERFANSKAGMWTAFLITWKVMGHDTVELTKQFIRWVVAFGLLIVGFPTWIYIFRKNCITHRVVKSMTRESFWKVKKTYENSNAVHDNWAAAYAGFLFAFLVLCTLIAFA